MANQSTMRSRHGRDRSKTPLIIAGVLLLLALIGVGVYFLFFNGTSGTPSPSPSPSATAPASPTPGISPSGQALDQAHFTALLEAGDYESAAQYAGQYTAEQDRSVLDGLVQSYLDMQLAGDKTEAFCQEKLAMVNQMIAAGLTQNAVGAAKTQLETLIAQYGEEMVEYTGVIEHVFTHSLIAFPDLAYKSMTPDQIVKSTYFIDMITVQEFKNIIQELYDRGYMLININDFLEETEVDGLKTVTVKKKFLFPKNKKPLIFSFDDTVYDSRKKDEGLVDKLILKDGKIMTYTLYNGQETISDDNEFIPILDAFVAEHPDFSYNGAKGMLCLTGFQGVFGYRTQSSRTYAQGKDRDEEIVQAKAIAQHLKDTGWYFSSHSYGHGNMETMSNDSFIEDCKRWDNEVRPIVGDTVIYTYAFGANVKEGAKHEELLKRGFRVFNGVGTRQYCTYRSDVKGVFMDRANLDGQGLVKNAEMLQYSDDQTSKSIPRFFDPKLIFDPVGRKMTYQQAYDAFMAAYGTPID